MNKSQEESLTTQTNQEELRFHLYLLQCIFTITLSLIWFTNTLIVFCDHHMKHFSPIAELLFNAVTIISCPAALILFLTLSRNKRLRNIRRNRIRSLPIMN